MGEDDPSYEAAPSPGCAVAPACSAGYRREELSVHEPALGGNVTRGYLLDLPEQACDESARKPAPLFLWFHGQGGVAADEAAGLFTHAGYRGCARSNGFISVLPQGIDDYVKSVVDVNGIPSNNGQADLGTGWNVGTGGDEDTCWKEEDGKEFAPTQYSCYQSCIDLNKCGRCNWSTCHDDVAFTTTLLSHLADSYCIDLKRIYLGGESNGGMMTHYLSLQLPSAFAAVTPMFGLPLLGEMAGPKGEALRDSWHLQETSIIEFHDRQDKIIPANGGLSVLKYWTWYYTPLANIMDMWSAALGCSAEAENLAVPMVHSKDFECVTFSGCSSGQHVISCLYDGAHGDWPKPVSGERGGVAGNAAFWLFNQAKRKTPGVWK